MQNLLSTSQLRQADWWQRVQTAQRVARENKLILVLKNQYTFVCLPDGSICVNNSGNPAMAQAGMGDTLTGIIAAFLAQGYAAELAALMAVFVHGSAGDELANELATVSSSQLINQIPVTIKRLVSKHPLANA